MVILQAAQSKRYRYQFMIRSGFHRISPEFLYGFIYRGHLDEIFGSDSLDVDLVNMRDGMYAQYFSPRFFRRTSPNMPLPSSLVYKRQTAHLFTQLSVVQYQNFIHPCRWRYNRCAPTQYFATTRDSLWAIGFSL